MVRTDSRAHLALAPAAAHPTTTAVSEAPPGGVRRGDAIVDRVRRWRSPSLLASFGHALHGLVELTATERNMKLHVWTGLGVCVLASEVLLPMAAQLAVLISMVLVLGAEAINSAFEALVDLHTTDRREEARRVKDAAAGAVLALSVGAATVAGVVVSRSWEGGIVPLGQLRAHFVWDCLIAVLAGSLLALGKGRRAVKVAAGAGGIGLLAVLASRTVSVPFTGFAAALFLLAGASARYTERRASERAEHA